MEKEYFVDELKTRLDKFLAAQSEGSSRSQIQRDIEAGQVAVNGQRVLESKFVVRKGDKVAYRPSPRPDDVLTPTNTPLKILYNEHGLLIIDKPAGLAVHPGAGFKGETLASALLYHFKDIHLVGEEQRHGIVHRLDKDTSGVMLVATTQQMYEHLKNAFAERKIKKEYLALVVGRIEKPHGFLDSPIGRSRSDFRKYAVSDMIEPKDALTEYRVLEYLKGPEDGGVAAGVDEMTLVRVKLHTGRTHQIRVHFSSIGHPLMGDVLYGNAGTALAGLKRQFLHARKIEVRMPDGTWIEAESYLADDLKKVLEKLGSKSVNSL